MKSENVQKLKILRHLCLLCGLTAGVALMAGGLPSFASAQEAMV